MRKKLLIALALVAGCSTPQQEAAVADAFDGEAELGCAACVFGTDDPGCPLAVRIGDEVYLCTGAGIDDFGDAHAADGLCHVARPARVAGTVQPDGTFAVELATLTD